MPTDVTFGRINGVLSRPEDDNLVRTKGTYCAISEADEVAASTSLNDLSLSRKRIPPFTVGEDVTGC